MRTEIDDLPPALVMDDILIMGHGDTQEIELKDHDNYLRKLL